MYVVMISHKMNIWHPWQLKKSKSWGPFWSYQLNSTANSAQTKLPMYSRLFNIDVYSQLPKRTTTGRKSPIVNKRTDEKLQEGKCPKIN